MGLFLLIAGAVALGALVTVAVVFTFKWLKKRIKQKFEKKNVKKVAAMTLEKLVDECPNEISLDNLMDEGYTDILATLDSNGQIDEVEVIKNIGDEDPEINRLYGEPEMVVITR